MAHSYKDRLMNFESLAKFGHINSNRLNIIWEFPVVDEVVLNCYSSVIENGRMSTCGGVVCDHTRFYFRIHLEFGRNFSPCSRVEGYIIGTKTSLVKRIQENKSGLWFSACSAVSFKRIMHDTPMYYPIYSWHSCSWRHYHLEPRSLRNKSCSGQVS